MRLYYPNARATLSIVFAGNGATSDTDPFIVPVNPRGLSICRNPYRQADSWSLEFDAADLPIPPQSIRTGQVEIYLYGTDGLGDPRRNETKGRNPAAVGLFDKAGCSFDESTREFSISGQDFTALFLAKKWDPRDRIRPGSKLSRILEELIARVDPTLRLRLDWQAEIDPIVGKVDNRRIARRGYTPKNADNFWDVITDVCARYGFVVFVEDFSIVVTTPRERLEARDERRRALIWGHSLASLEINRNMGKERTPVIRVVSWDEDAQVTRQAEYPDSRIAITKAAKTFRGKDKGKRVAAGATPYGVGTDFDEVRVYPVSGITDPVTLKRAAQTIYELYARGEQEVSFTTEDLTDDLDRDLLELRSGDPLDIGFDPFNQDEIRTLNVGQREQYLLERGYGPQVSRTIAANVDLLLAIRKPYRVREFNLDYDSEEGINLSGEIQEFVALDPQKKPPPPPTGRARLR